MLLCVAEVSTSQVPCEGIKVPSYFNHKSCLMNRTTTIDSPRFTILSAVDDSVEGLFLADNKKISHLPVGVDKVFRKLLIIVATSCSIKNLTNENFSNLTQLTTLYLGANQIEKIMSDTFTDLRSLVTLDLSKKTFSRSSR